MVETAPTAEQVAAFLRDLHGAGVHDLEPLSGGFWSSAFGYRVDDRELVLRLGNVPEGFRADRDAMAFDRPDLPVPDVLDIGEALGRSYAISVRHHGRFLEDVSPDEADLVGPTVVRLLDALRGIPAADGGPGWRRWLLDALVDDPRQRVSGWREHLRSQPDIDRLFRECEHRIHELVGACPERRDVVHSDLLHGNVLVADDASRVTAVFSWKCSTRGDFLYDTAWCTFWGPWHPGIAAADVWGRMTRSLQEGGATEELVDAPTRHHCYELQIGTGHLGWNAWTGDQATLRAVADHLTHVLERGPLALL